MKALLLLIALATPALAQAATPAKAKAGQGKAAKPEAEPTTAELVRQLTSLRAEMATLNAKLVQKQDKPKSLWPPPKGGSFDDKVNWTRQVIGVGSDQYFLKLAGIANQPGLNMDGEGAEGGGD